MPMQMGFRWYGEGNDAITLNHIKQIPGVTSIVWALHHKMPGEIWEEAEIAEVMDQLHEYGFNGDVVESVNVHDDIKIGKPTRDALIENYKQCIRNLSKFGVKVICYNFMPIFDWTRSNLFHPVGDGSTALFYEKNMIQDDYNAMAKYILDFTEKYNMSFPGWEPERMAKLDELFKAYAHVDHETLWANLKYFLEAIMPTCEECGVKNGHPYGRSPLGHLWPAPAANQRGEHRPLPEDGGSPLQLPDSVLRLSECRPQQRCGCHRPQALRSHCLCPHS